VRGEGGQRNDDDADADDMPSKRHVLQPEASPK
jgi:hypothetical protein